VLGKLDSVADHEAPAADGQGTFVPPKTSPTERRKGKKAFKRPRARTGDNAGAVPASMVSVSGAEAPLEEEPGCDEPEEL